MQYVNLPTADKLQPEIDKLDEILTWINSGNITDQDESRITQYSIIFRIYEMKFTLLASKLNAQTAEYYRLLSDGLPTKMLEVEIGETANAYRRLNGLLYGEPQQHIYDEICGELWHRIDEKVTDGMPNATRLKTELEHGFVTERGVYVDGLTVSDKRLPKLSSNAAEFIGDDLREQYQQHWDIVNEYYKEHMEPRPEQDREFTNDDMTILFEQSLALLDPDGNSGIQISRKENSPNLAWDTPSLSVQVGTSERANPIPTAGVAFGKLMHELVEGHGGRTVSGLQTDMPILGYGVFSDFDPSKGEAPDYLAFEEGWNLLIESIARGDVAENDQWKMTDVALYLNISMAMLEGRSIREIYEISWRIRALESIKDGNDVTDGDIDRVKKAAARTLERHERSRPAGLPESAGLIVYTKDLAYASGRRKAVLVGDDIAAREDRESLRHIGGTKTDPTNPQQNSLATKAGYQVILSDGFTLTA